MREFDRSVTTATGNLAGSLYLPEGEAAYAALILAGSGALDRNGNGLGLQLNLYNALAQQLAQHGIASYRYDKRGCGHSDGEHLTCGYFDLLSDAENALLAVREYEELNGVPVILIGHSEGTLLSSELAAKYPNIHGQVLIAPFLDPLETVIERQLKQTLHQVNKLTGLKGLISRLALKISGDQIKKQRRVIAQVRASNSPTITIKKNVINAVWLRDHLNIDPRQVHLRCTTPTLSIGCAKDLQCPPQDAHTIASVINAAVESHVLDDLTHILRTDPLEPSTFRYKELSHEPIDERIAALISDWLQRTVD